MKAKQSPPRGRWLASACGFLSAVLLAGMVFSGPVLEQWHLLQLTAGSEGRKIVAAGWLAEYRSAAALPRLLALQEMANPRAL